MVARRPSAKSVCFGAQPNSLRSCRRVDRIPKVVAGPVDDVIEVVGIASHQFEQGPQHREVVAFAVGADQIGPPGATAVENAADRAVVIVDVDPVPDVGAGAVQLRSPPGQHVGDLPRDELLHMLIGPIVVGAVGDCRAHTVGPHPRPHQQVGGGLGRRVWARRVVGRGLGEPLGGRRAPGRRRPRRWRRDAAAPRAGVPLPGW